jgi:hypothetical protein
MGVIVGIILIIIVVMAMAQWDKEAEQKGELKAERNIWRAAAKPTMTQAQKQLVKTIRVASIAKAVTEGSSYTLPGIARELATEGYVTTHEYGHCEGFEVLLIRPLQRATAFVQTHAAEIHSHGWEKPQPELLKAVGEMGVYNQ